MTDNLCRRAGVIKMIANFSRPCKLPVAKPNTKPMLSTNGKPLTCGFIEAGQDDEGFRVRFGCSVEVNSNGYFVAFRERWRVDRHRSRKQYDQIVARQGQSEVIKDIEDRVAGFKRLSGKNGRVAAVEPD